MRLKDVTLLNEVLDDTEEGLTDDFLSLFEI